MQQGISSSDGKYVVVKTDAVQNVAIPTTPENAKTPLNYVVKTSSVFEGNKTTNVCQWVLSPSQVPPPKAVYKYHLVTQRYQVLDQSL